MIRQWTGTLAVTAILAYAGTVSFTAVKNTAIWEVNTVWLGGFALISGALFVLISERSIRFMIIASVLAAVVVAGLWSYILWSSLGGHISYLSLLNSNLCMAFVYPISAVVAIISIPSGIIGIIFTKLILGKD
jgi:hypothetical protein